MMSLTFGLFTQVSDLGPQGPLVDLHLTIRPANAGFGGLFNLSNH